jgi:hypothetical protein
METRKHLLYAKKQAYGRRVQQDLHETRKATLKTKSPSPKRYEYWHLRRQKKAKELALSLKQERLDALLEENRRNPRLQLKKLKRIMKEHDKVGIKLFNPRTRGQKQDVTVPKELYVMEKLEKNQEEHKKRIEYMEDIHRMLNSDIQPGSKPGQRGEDFMSKNYVKPPLGGRKRTVTRAPGSMPKRL